MESLGDLIKNANSHLVDLRWDQRFYISNKFPGDAMAADPRIQVGSKAPLNIGLHV